MLSSIKLNITFYIYCLFFIINIAYSQNLKLEVKGIQNQKAIIYSLEGEKIEKIDSIISTSNDNFSYIFNKNKYHIGFYRADFGQNIHIDFIYDGGDIDMYTNAEDAYDSLHVINSLSNQLYYSFIKLNKTFKTKTELLQLLLAKYPKDDAFYEKTKVELHHIQENYSYFINIISQKIPGSFIARYIKSYQLPIINASLPPDQQLAFLKAHSLDNVDFKDGELTYSDLFTVKTIEYLSYYRNPQMPKRILENEFITAIDKILNKAKVNYRVYKQIVEYLIDGFKKFGFENDLKYIIDNYVIKDDLCLDNKTEKSIQLMLNQDKILHIDAIAPDITLQDPSGKIVKLDKIISKKILIVFYASWCPHCQVLIPKLKEYLDTVHNPDLKILAISLDTKRADWINFIKRNNLKWINISDLKGWDGKAALDYYLYATPTMYLIDKNKKIIAKPLTIDDLKKWL